MATKLYPPQLEGTLPAFYKSYEKIGDTINYDNLEGAKIQIPFGINRGISRESIAKISCRLRTIATNTYLVVKDVDTIDLTNDVCNLILDAEEAKKFNEGQYYKVQLAFIDTDEVVGYYSTIGVIKCVAKPKVSINGYEASQTNQFTTDFVGVYQQDTHFGDSTEKAYSYSFVLEDDRGNIVDEITDVLHDSTQDITSFSSRDMFRTYKNIADGSFGYITYKVTTMNGLVAESPRYQVMKSVSVDMEDTIKLKAKTNFENGYIELMLEGKPLPNAIGSYREAITSGTFVIYRGNELDNYSELEEISRFVINAGYPSDYTFRDYTVQQGVKYRYYIQQYNINKVYSNRIQSLNIRLDDPYNLYDEPTLADFEDMFLYDGERQLKIRFNPKVDSFKNSIPEQKIETIGSKYPFIFRNGKVCYKEFPIAGLISFQMDESTLFLNNEELRQAGIMENDYYRQYTHIDEYLAKKLIDGHEANYEKVAISQPIIDSLTGQPVKDKNGQILYKTIYNYNPKSSSEEKIISYDNTNALDDRHIESDTEYPEKVVRMNKDLTTENIMGERYFKLKVLDWLTDGKVKLFRSPGEGNYLVRLLNVSMKPKDPLGRMLHDFTCTGYEIDELTYDNLVYYGIVNNRAPNITEMHWGSIDLNPIIENIVSDPNWRENPEWIYIPTGGASIEGFSLTGFVPGDQIRVTFADAPENKNVIFTIGSTGTFNYEYDDYLISGIEILPNLDPYQDFDRNIIFRYPGLLLTKFDTISAINTHTQIAEEFVGPKDNLMKPFELLDLYNESIPEGHHNPEVSYIYNKIFNNIINKNSINFRFNSSANKFMLTNVDILKVRKRIVIPIYACENFMVDEEGNYIISDSTKYNVTPFGIGYVNSKIITEEDEHGELKTLETIEVGPDVDDINGKINALDIKEITKDENNLYKYQMLGEPLIDGFTILKVYIPKKDGDKLVWQESTQSGFRYFDTYYNVWWPSDLEYDPTFAINEIDTNHLIEKANKFTSQNGEWDWHPDEVDEATALKQQFQVPIYSSEQLNTIYNNYETQSIDEEDKTNRISVNEIEEITLYNLGKLTYLSLGTGVMAEITAQLQVIDYLVEETNSNVAEAKSSYKSKDKQGNLTGVYAEFQKALHAYMTQINQVNQAKEKQVELQNAISNKNIELENYQQAKGDLPNFLTSVSEVIDDLKYKLFYQIQGAPNTLKDEINDDYIFTDESVINLSSHIKKVIKDQGITEEEFQQVSIEVPLDDFDIQRIEYSGNSENIINDKIILTFRNHIKTFNVIDLDYDSSNQYYYFDIYENKNYSLNQPITKIEIQPYNNEFNRNIKIYNYNKRISQIFKFLSVDSREYNVNNSNNSFWPISGIVIPVNETFRMNYIYNLEDNTILVQHIQDGGISQNTNSSLRSEDESTIITFNFKQNTSFDEDGKLIIPQSFINSYKQELQNIINDHNFYSILEFYKVILNYSQEAVRRYVGIINIISNTLELYDENNNITYRTFIPWLIKQLISEDLDENDTPIGKVWQLYDLLHYFGALPEDLYTIEQKTGEHKPLSRAEYGDIFIIYPNDDSNPTGQYLEHMYYNINDFQVYTYNEEDPPVRSRAPVSNNIYMDNTNTLFKHHYQGKIVDTYDEIISLEEEYKTAFIKYDEFKDKMELEFPSDSLTDLNELKNQLSNAQSNLEAAQLRLDNKDAYEEFDNNNESFTDDQYKDLDTYLRKQVIKWQREVERITEAIDGYTINDKYTVEDYEQSEKEKNILQGLANNIYNNLSTKVTEYNNLVNTYIALLVYTGSGSDDKFNAPMTFLELLDEYEKAILKPKSALDNIIDPITTNNYENYNIAYNTYLDHINQLIYSEEDKTGIVTRVYDKIIELINNYLKAIENYNNYQTQIDNIQKEIAVLTEQINLLQPIININIPEEFNNDEWMTRIESNLAKYLTALTVAYKEEVEDRYSI